VLLLLLPLPLPLRLLFVERRSSEHTSRERYTAITTAPHHYCHYLLVSVDRFEDLDQPGHRSLLLMFGAIKRWFTGGGGGEDGNKDQQQGGPQHGSDEANHAST